MPSTVVTSTEVPSTPATSASHNLDQLPAESDHDRFLWSYTEEPHRTRRHAIIKAYPEVTFPLRSRQTSLMRFQVTKLCGPEPLTKYVVVAVVAMQLICAASLRNTAIFSLPFLLTAYIVGATANQNLFLAIHEISHNLAFKTPIANRLLAIFANLPIGIPYSAAFRVRTSPVVYCSRSGPS